jgi:tRNA/tmRNA/rRNA uracil-C5-methylase (TrmA/RlmC/RlmD family)
LVTSSQATETQIDIIAEGILALQHVSSVRWIETDAKSKVAQGISRKVYGEETLQISLANKRFFVPHDGFFQVNTVGMEALIQCIEQACSDTHTLLDLYCGVGSIGIAISHLFKEVIGIELHEESILWARKNAEANNVQGQWYAGPVEKVLPTLSFPSNSLILVDPPRAGLHPKAAKFLANQETEKLVYVACSPASLARDSLILVEGGWNPKAIWSVDLFPQTPHIETVALFTKACQ